MSERINISAPSINKELAYDYIQQAIESGQIAQGPGVAQAEKDVSEALGARYTALYANGTASLRGALISSVANTLGSDEYVDRYIEGKEVVIPAFSFNATLNTVLDSGAVARVVDVREDDFGIDPEHVANVTNNKTIAIMPVDLYGQAASVYRDDHRFDDLAIVRDAAQAHGAQIDDKPLVEHADAVSLSFYPTKNIAAPEGGAIVTNNAGIDKTARIYRNQGMSAPYVYEMLGDNLRMTDIHAAVLRANIGTLAFVTQRRNENAALLTEGLEDTEGLVLPRIQERRNHVWHQYTVRVQAGEFGMNRDDLRDALNVRGIGSGVYYPKTMTDHPVFTDHPRIRLEATPIANKIAKEVLSLPVHPGVNQDDVYRIVETIKDIKRSA